MAQDFLITLCNRISPVNPKVRSAVGAILLLSGSEVTPVGLSVEGLEKHSGVSGLAKVGDEWWFVLQAGATNSLLIMDGDLRKARIKPLAVARDSHGLIPWEDGALIVSTGTNQVMRLDKSGKEVGVYGPNPDVLHDAEHLNDVCIFQGRVIGSKFGHARRNGKRIGCVYDVQTGEHIFDGLDSPHSVVAGPEYLHVAESGTGAIFKIHPEFQPRLVNYMIGYARGLYVDDQVTLIGRSKSRALGRTSALLHRAPMSSAPDGGQEFTKPGVFVIDNATGDHSFVDVSAHGPEVYAISPLV